nr:PREDICTED: uncharacterized protein LOC109034700 [Bemisia tabaci]
MDLIGCLIVVGLVIVSSVSCSEHKPKHEWTEDECEVECLKEKGYFDTSGIEEINTEILPVADAHVKRLKGGASEAKRWLDCKCTVPTKNPAFEQYLKANNVTHLMFKAMRMGGWNFAQKRLKNKGIIVQLPHSEQPAASQPEIHSKSPKQHKWTEEECENECWKKEGYLVVNETDQKKNPNGLTEVAIADAQLEDEEDGKTECKCVVDNNNSFLKMALNMKKVHLEAFVRQHQSNPHIARLWLASKGFKTVLEQKKKKQKTDKELAQESCVEECIKLKGWVLLPQEHKGPSTRVPFADGKMEEKEVFNPVVRNNKTISVWSSKELCNCNKPGAKLLAYLQEKGLTTEERKEFNISFKRGTHNGAQWLKNHYQLDVQPGVNPFEEETYLKELKQIKPARFHKTLDTVKDEHHKMHIRGKRLLAACLPIRI